MDTAFINFFLGAFVEIIFVNKHFLKKGIKIHIMGAKVKLVIHLYCCFQTDGIDNGSERSIRPKTQTIEPLRREQ